MTSYMNIFDGREMVTVDNLKICIDKMHNFDSPILFSINTSKSHLRFFDISMT